MSESENHRYPRKSLVADYIRAAIGVFLPIALMLFTDLLPLVFYAMAALVLLFGIYGLRTAWRHGTVLVVDEDGVRQEGPLGGILDRNIAWAEMGDFRLRYYSTRRDGRDGWMHLVLRGGRAGRIRLDSTLPGFDGIVGRAHGAATAGGLSIDPTSATNLAALGFGGDETPTKTSGASPASTPLDNQYPS